MKFPLSLYVSLWDSLCAMARVSYSLYSDMMDTCIDLGMHICFNVKVHGFSFRVEKSQFLVKTYFDLDIRDYWPVTSYLRYFSI